MIEVELSSMDSAIGGLVRRYNMFTWQVNSYKFILRNQVLERPEESKYSYSNFVFNSAI